MASHRDQENSLDVVNSKLQVFSYDVFAILDSGTSLSSVNPYVVIKLGFFPRVLLRPSVLHHPSVSLFLL